jgi:hypothetical protein
MKFSDGRPIAEQIGSGGLLALKCLGGIAVSGALVVGLNLLFFPHQRNPEYFAGRHPFALGTVLLGIATVVLISTVQRWASILPGILAYGVLGGCLAIASGHIPNTRVPFPRPAAVYLTAFLVISTILTYTFAKRRLTILDRMVLIGFIFCLAISMQSNQPFYVYIVPVIGLCLLLPAWFLARKRRQWEELMAYRRRHHIPERLYQPQSWHFKS